MKSPLQDKPLLVTEIFHSIQGETSETGIPYTFIRLTGCNLRCTYCDSSYSFHGGTQMSVDQIMLQVEKFNCKKILLTGGEPLLQRPITNLCKTLFKNGFEVSIETHGEVSISQVTAFARIIMDVKTPSSGMCRKGFTKNYPFLKTNDEIKFVIASQEDYEWAKEIIGSHELPTKKILLSVAQPAEGSPGKFPGISLQWLAEKILSDRLPVRLQIQLHKLIWGSNSRGV